MAGKPYHGFPVPEEVRIRAIHHRKHVIIEIEELFREAGNLVKEHLDCSAVEGGQELFRNNVLVQNYPDC